MTPAELKKIVNLSSTYVIDVREQDELSNMLPFAKSIPMSMFGKVFALSDNEFASTLGFSKFTKEDTIILVCFSGGRSGHIAAFLRSHGYGAHNLDGGMLAWR